MSRKLALVALVLCLSPVPLYAQATEFTVTAAADVYRSPSTGALIVGKASTGTVLPVTRELGSWVKVAWPTADDGVGYVHVSRGQISHDGLAVSRQAARNTPSITSISSTTATSGTTASSVRVSNPASSSTSAGAAQVPQPVSATTLAGSSSTPAAHHFGLGARMGSTPGFGVSARAAMTDHFGIQLELSRYTPASLDAQQHLSSVQLAPSLLYSLPDKLTDYVWIRPYLGAGVNWYRSTVGSVTPGADSTTENGLGRQVFGGTAVAFASAPQFTLSVDYGYRWNMTPLAGVDMNGPGFSLSGHWYLK